MYNSSYFYRAFQFGGWLSFFIINAIFVVISQGFSIPIIAVYILTTLTGFILSHLFRVIIKKYSWADLSISKLIGRVLVCTFIMSLIWASTTLIYSDLIFGTDSISANLYTALVFSMMVILIIWSLIYFFYKIFISYRESEIEKWKLSIAAKDAQLTALKSQINPHFIFNSLNNIRSLIVENPGKARDMITHLSGLFRYNLRFTHTERVTLAEEINIVKNYLNLESIQLEDRLEYEISLEHDLRDAQIPPMSIQLLVENAIKHGINKLPDGGKVLVKVREEDSKILIEVINSGRIVENDAEIGIGLKNATERLKLLFGNNAEITLENTDRSNVKASFTIPLNFESK